MIKPSVKLLPLMAAALWLSSCSLQETSHNSAKVLRSLSPIPDITLTRSANFTLPHNAHLYVAIQNGGLQTSADERANTAFAEKLASALGNEFALITLGQSIEPLAQARQSALAKGANFIIVPAVLALEDIKPLKQKKCPADDTDCKRNKKPLIKQSSVTKIKVTLYESNSGDLVNAINATAQRGITAYVKSGQDQQLDNIALAVSQSLSD